MGRLRKQVKGDSKTNTRVNEQPKHPKETKVGKAIPESKDADTMVDTFSNQSQRKRRYTPKRNASKNIKYIEKPSCDTDDGDDEYPPQSDDDNESDCESDKNSVKCTTVRGGRLQKQSRKYNRRDRKDNRRPPESFSVPRVDINLHRKEIKADNTQEEKNIKFDQFSDSLIAVIGNKPNLSESESSDSDVEATQIQKQSVQVARDTVSTKDFADTKLKLITNRHSVKPAYAASNNVKGGVDINMKLEIKEENGDVENLDQCVINSSDHTSKLTTKRKRARSRKSIMGQTNLTGNIKLEQTTETSEQKTKGERNYSDEHEKVKDENNSDITEKTINISIYDMAIPGPSGNQSNETYLGYSGDSMSEESLSDSENSWEDVDEIKLPKDAHLESSKKKFKLDKEAKDVEIRLKVPSIHQDKRAKREEKYMKFIEQAIRRFKRETQVNIHKVHLLCLVAHYQILNKLCNDSILRALFLSMVPKHITRVPNAKWDLTHLPRIVHWFQTEVPPVQSLLNTLDKIRSSNCLDRIHVLVCMLRALGFLVRLIVSLQPSSPKVKTGTKSRENKRKIQGPRAKGPSDGQDKNTKKDGGTKSGAADKCKGKKSSSSTNSATKNTKIKDRRSKEIVDTVSSETSPYFKDNKESRNHRKVQKLEHIKNAIQSTAKRKLPVAGINKKSKSDKIRNEEKEISKQSKKGDVSKRIFLENVEMAKNDRKCVSEKNKGFNKSKELRDVGSKIEEGAKRFKNRQGTESESPSDNADKRKKDKNVMGASDSNIASKGSQERQVDKDSNSKAATVNMKKSESDRKILRKRKRVSYVESESTEKDSDVVVDFKENKYSSDDAEFETNIPKYRTPCRLARDTSKQRRIVENKPVKVNESCKKRESEKKRLSKGKDKQHSSKDDDSVSRKRSKSPSKVSKKTDKSGKKSKDISSDSEGGNEDRKGHSSEKMETRTEQGVDHWLEIYLPSQRKWICIEITGETVNNPEKCELYATKPLQYIIGIDNDGAVKDVTCRYASKWLSQTRKLRIDREWWAESLEPFRSEKKDLEKEEDAQLRLKLLEKPMPTSIAEIKGHPLYVLEDHLLKFEAIYPPTAAVLGFIRGKAVYSRDCVHTLHAREKWMQDARNVKKNEEPYKIVKGRPKRNTPVHERDNVKLGIYGIWQTEIYKPPRAKNGKVPRNEYGNVELFKASMLPLGTVHIPIHGIQKTARRLNIDVAPAMKGWDFHAGFAHPIIEGVVVCKEFEEKLLDGWTKDEEEILKKQKAKREKKILDRWKLLTKGLIVKERLRRKYDFDGIEDSKDSSSIIDDVDVTDVSVSWPLNRLDGTTSIKEEGHCHVFPESSHKQDNVTEEWTKSCSCGLTLPFEKL